MLFQTLCCIVIAKRSVRLLCYFTEYQTRDKDTGRLRLHNGCRCKEITTARVRDNRRNTSHSLRVCLVFRFFLSMDHRSVR